MKKYKNKIINIILFVLMTVMLVPTTATAETYTLSDTDISIEFDDSQWYVFTRDNLQNNEELEELGLSYDYLDNFMKENNVYLDAVLFFADSEEYIEIFVRKAQNDEIINLSNYDENDVLELAEALADKQNTSDYEVYQADYNYARLNYSDKGFYVDEYYTIVNGYLYVITAQKPSELSDSDIARIEEIVDSVEFKIDTSLKEKSSESGFDWNEVFKSAIGGAIAGGVGGAIVMLIKKKKAK